MKLKDYQKIAVDKLLSISKKLLQKEGMRICVLKAPTGSGKTIMVADFLDQLAHAHIAGAYSFIWISGNKLHEQSRAKLEGYLSESRYSFSYLDEASAGSFSENEIVFVNWHSLTRQDNETGEYTNVFMKENEQDRDLPTFIRNTKAEGREVILIVDESHYHYWSKKSQELVQSVIGPKLILEVSATPTNQPTPDELSSGDAGYVAVKYDDVVAEGMIKNEIVINKDVGKFSDIQRSADEVVIDAAIEKQKELKKRFVKIDVDINPLVLIQLPSESQTTSVLDKTKLEFVEAYLKKKHGVTVENGRLAVWLSNRKDNVVNVEMPNAKVDVMIFKQAIALGWDCPRAQILVMFREIQSQVFEIQTVGRVLRMPEAKHYEDEELNRAFVYTNLPAITIAADDASQRFFQVHPAHRIEGYEAVKLPSVYIGRTDFGDLTLSFRKLFIEEANKRCGIGKDDIMDKAFKKADKLMELYPEELTHPVISDAVVGNLDEAREIAGEKAEFAIPEDELKYRFEQFAKIASLPYAPVRSHTKVQQAIYDWFDGYLGYEKRSRIEIQRAVVCSEANQKLFAEIIEAAKARFADIRRSELDGKKSEQAYEWDVQAIEYFNERHERIAVSNYAMDKCYVLTDRSKPEKDFELTVAAAKGVLWWYKNGVSKRDYFAVPYDDPKTGARRAFYLDYVVVMKDGSVSIFDTKSGVTADSAETGAKSDALQAYIKRNTTKSKRICGGIVVSRQDGTFVFVGSKYTSDPRDKGWVRLEL
ncbi:hypothetical protein EPO34_00735 [Patescibacteria group bacterium]|nr:MAG: hypothetical protein EPO34_00735 [Patescibacteria group bacterium]